MVFRRNLKEGYSPLLFLASLGSGGAIVSMFMFLMFWVPHRGRPLATFADWMAAFNGPEVGYKVMVPIVLIGIAFFTYLHIRTLIWNISEFRKFKASKAYEGFLKSNNGIQLMALPLTFAMSLNASFIVGAVFVPRLWDLSEFLFPAAIVGFLVIGYFALKIFTGFMVNALVHGHFDCEKNNSLAQMLSVFSLSMVGVGLSAPAAMSHVKVTAAIGFIGAVFFLTAAIVFGLIKLILGFRSMMNNGVNQETTPTLWIIIPILTVIGIGLFRLTMGLDHNFGAPHTAGGIFALLTTLLALQLIFGLLGYAIMKQVGYFETFVTGSGKSPGSLALVCPGIALVVMANFFINWGLVGIGLVEKFSITYFILYLPVVYLQIKTYLVLLRLTDKLLGNSGSTTPATAAPAE
ncbi:TsoY family (seleno)protein [Cohaesibacter gelatinilyticus]|uniref:Voltage-dependent anion channel n=1 Tax=Cohaesibacter gelatinilyticus TaxID=372072 RepID=A0A285NBY4_9HYPH|nr:hypothetical protein [Cohaesibacter gelatinilyticus]SNZ06929.1 hypothetical protein SAMN06265368_0587 [Cohaesibacter gelatinilyticus]